VLRSRMVVRGAETDRSRAHSRPPRNHWHAVAALSALGAGLSACGYGGARADGGVDAVADAFRLWRGDLPETNPTSPDARTILRACLLAETCHTTPYWFYRPADCFLFGYYILGGGLSPLDRQLLACAEHFTDCAAGRACVARGYGADYCAEHPGTSCHNDNVVRCDSTSAPAVSVDDCRAREMRCALLPADSTLQGECVADIQCRSPSVQYSSWCEGDQVAACASDRRHTRLTNCNDVLPGSACRERSGLFGPSAGCEHGSPQCNWNGAICQGGMLQDCFMDRLFVTDCARRLGGPCVEYGVENGSRRAACEPPPSPLCERGSWCEGSTFAMCFEGRALRMDCQSLGFRTCEPTGPLDAHCLE